MATMNAKQKLHCRYWHRCWEFLHAAGKTKITGHREPSFWGCGTFKAERSFLRRKFLLQPPNVALDMNYCEEEEDTLSSRTHSIHCEVSGGKFHLLQEWIDVESTWYKGGSKKKVSSGELNLSVLSFSCQIWDCVLTAQLHYSLHHMHKSTMLI